jgi:hypothetical protein
MTPEAQEPGILLSPGRRHRGEWLYSNAEGVVDQIRVGRTGTTGASVIWRRDPSGRWPAAQTTSVPLVDFDRLACAGSREVIRKQLERIAGILLSPGQRFP